MRSTARSTRRLCRERVVKLPEEGKFEEWKKGLMKELRDKSFRTFPERIPAPKTLQA